MCFSKGMQNKLKVVKKQFNSTSQSWYHFMHQLCGKVLSFIVPLFTTLSIEINANEKVDVTEEKENNFGED